MSNAELTYPSQFYSPHASLAALGLKLQRLGVFKTLDKHLKIKQKVLKYHPTTKLYSVLVAILAGMQSMVELNKILRADPALQKAFGLSGCAEQSTIQDTLDKCDQANLAQMQAAVNEIYQGLAKAPNHNFAQGLLLVDSDFTPSPAGLLAEKGSKGYFGKLHHHFGRQIGRVIATHYQEIVVEQLYAGNIQLNIQFQALVLEAEKRLDLDEAKRHRTVLRADSNAGSLENINWALGRGYHYHGKAYSGSRAGLSESVKEWIKDPKQVGREVGLLGDTIPNGYLKPLKRIAVRCQKQNGQWSRSLIVSSLSEAQIVELVEGEGEGDQKGANSAEAEQALLDYVYFYDQRGGGIESEIKQDRQGLGLGHRNKRHFEGQAILQQLLALAHNLLIWARGWLSEKVKEIADYGLKRLVRDVFEISGLVEFEQSGRLKVIKLNGYDPLATKLVSGLLALVRPPAT